MITIALCDDARQDLLLLEELIRQMNPFDGQFTLDVFQDGAALLASDKRPFDMVVLDVQMPLSGYETASRLRETDRHTVLAFLTGVAAPTVEVFRVTPFRYLMKQMEPAQLREELSACFHEVERTHRFVTFQSGGELLRLQVSSILYLMIQGRCVEIVTDHGRYTLKARMADMYSLLAPHGFGYCHKSYLCSFSRVMSVSSGSVVMENGDILPVSQPKAKSFKSEFLRFAGDTVG
jgi:DNA-binding LytR/AlgR family response regulator